MKLIETFKNIGKIEELRKRLLYTLGLILIYRFGSFVVIPGIDPNALAAMQSQTADGLLGLLDIFSGGAFSNASIFALGVMPYISASIVVQLLGIIVPYFQRLQKGERVTEDDRFTRIPDHYRPVIQPGLSCEICTLQAPLLSLWSTASSSSCRIFVLLPERCFELARREDNRQGYRKRIR